MSSVIKFTPLSGCYNEGPLCYLLQMDDINILLDCGWDDRFNINDEHLQQLKKLVNQIDIVLLSHSDIYHVGALPYLVGKLGLLDKSSSGGGGAAAITDGSTSSTTTSATTAAAAATTTTNKTTQIFATLPVCKMGTMTMYDMYLHTSATRDDFQVFDLDDVDSAFDSITQLKYSQRYRFKTERGSALTIMPFNAGHSLGGTVWKIVKETDEIVYAVDYNHRKERHLNGTAFDILGKPSILITDATSALNRTMYNAAHEARILNTIIETLRSGGNVLIPCDSAGRSLELALLLEYKWRQDKGLGMYPIIMFSPMSVRTIEFASHQLEWMSDDVMKGFHDSRVNPFSFQYTHLCKDMESFDNPTAYGKNPRVVLATTESLECGFSRELFVRWASNPYNLILFTGRTREDSLARQIVDNMKTINEHRMDKMNERAHAQGAYETTIEYRKRVPLQGQELKDYEVAQQKLKELEKKKKEDEKRKKVQGKVIQIRDEDASAADVDNDEDDDDDIMQDILEDAHRSQKDSSAYQSRLFLPENMKYHSQYLMFPCLEHYPKSDVYGQWIDAEEMKNRTLMIYEAETASIAANQMDIEEEEHVVIPTKCVSEELVIQVRSRIEFIDFEGRSNAASVQNILKQLAPRKLLLVHGSEEETTTLVDKCNQLKISDYIQAPHLNETLEVSMDTNMFKVKLSQDLLAQVSYAKVGAYELSYVQGEYRFDDLNTQASSGAVPQGTNEQDLAKLPSIVPLPEKSANGHDSIFIGDVKLSQFYDILSKNGVRTEFIQGGHLVCNDAVIIKRDGKTGQITLDGAFCTDYYLIRSLLYSQYQIL